MFLKTGLRPQYHFLCARGISYSRLILFQKSMAETPATINAKMPNLVTTHEVTPFYRSFHLASPSDDG
jgi:hypothetical protein